MEAYKFISTAAAQYLGELAGRITGGDDDPNPPLEEFRAVKAITRRLFEESLDIDSLSEEAILRVDKTCCIGLLEEMSILQAALHDDFGGRPPEELILFTRMIIEVVAGEAQYTLIPLIQEFLDVFLRVSRKIAPGETYSLKDKSLAY